MALIKGALVRYADPILGVRTVIPFQYNPQRIRRTLRFEAPLGAAATAAAGRELAKSPFEDYSLTLEFDATDALEREGPLTLAMGIEPRLAALEMLMQPLGGSELANQAAGAGTPVPRRELALVLFVWGPGRVTPVRLTSLVIEETAFDELLNPIHASVELAFTVIRSADAGDATAKHAASFYESSRELKAVLQMAQTVELLAP